MTHESSGLSLSCFPFTNIMVISSQKPMGLPRVGLPRAGLGHEGIEVACSCATSPEKPRSRLTATAAQGATQSWRSCHPTQQRCDDWMVSIGDFRLSLSLFRTLHIHITYTFMNISICIYIYICLYLFIYIYVVIYFFLYIYIHMWCAFIFMAFIVCVHIYINIYIYICRDDHCLKWSQDCLLVTLALSPQWFKAGCQWWNSMIIQAEDTRNGPGKIGSLSHPHEGMFYLKSSHPTEHYINHGAEEIWLGLWLYSCMMVKFKLLLY